MKLTCAFLLLLSLLTLTACDEEEGGGGPFGGGKKTQSDPIKKDPTGSPAEGMEQLEARCLDKWKTYWTSFRVGEVLRYRHENKLGDEIDAEVDDASESDETIEVANHDHVRGSHIDTNRIAFMYDCVRGKTPDQEMDGKDGSGIVSFTTPAGTFTVDWRRQIHHHPNEEYDVTRHTFVKGGRRIVVKEYRKNTRVRPEGLEVLIYTKELVSYRP